MARVMERVADELERLTLTYGQEIFARSIGAARSCSARHGGTNGSWTGPWATKRSRCSSFASSMCLPLLERSQDIARHLREYFDEACRVCRRWAQLRPALAAHQGPGRRLLAGRHASTPTGMARRFIAGSNLEEALRTVAKLRRKQLAFTVDLLGEATITEAEAERCQEAYLHLVDGLSRAVNAWPATARSTATTARPAAARQCVGQAVVALQPVRPDRPGRHQRGGARAGCGRSCGRPRSTARSSTSTWSSTPSRT